MRYFVRTCKFSAFASFQINNTFASYLRKGQKSGALWIHGMRAVYSGNGWFKMALETKYVKELHSAMTFLKGRLKNFRMLANAKPVVQQLEELVAIKSFFKHEVFEVKRVRPVVYQTIGHRVIPTVINRATQACIGLRDQLAQDMRRLTQATVMQDKLVALQAKFSH